MSPTTRSRPQSQQKTWLPTVFTLALWQLRRTWGLLMLAGMGVLASVILVCVAPLYSQVASTAGLRDTLSASVHNSTLIVSGQSTKLLPADQQGLTSLVDKHVQDGIAPFIKSKQFSITTSFLPLEIRTTPQEPLHVSNDLLTFVSYPMDQAQGHLKLVQGRLPGDGLGEDKTLEIALTQESATNLHLQLGSVIGTDIATAFEPVFRKDNVFPLKVVGIFEQPAADDFYWHGTSFLSYVQNADANITRYIYSPLVSNVAFTRALASLWPTGNQVTSGDPTALSTLELPMTLSWYYNLEMLKITQGDLKTLTASLSNAQIATSNDPQLYASPEAFSKLTVQSPVDALTHFSDESSVATIPVMGFVLIIFFLILYFVSLMADFLVERHAGALALLRSRGASRQQIFGSLLVQSSIIALLSFLSGPFLAVEVVLWSARALLPARSLSAVNVLIDHPLAAALSVWLYALTTALIVLLAMMVAINNTTSLDVLAMRREASRATRKPLWLRWNLDLVAVVMMVVGYIVTAYLTNSNILDPQLRLLLLSPLVLARTIFSVLAAILLFLRIFPYLLSLGSWLTIRNRGAASMVALAQMSRSPRQALRLTLLLSLATAFAIFALIFYSSQAQRAYDVAAYQVGSDFSGIPVPMLDLTNLNDATHSYENIPGVKSASLGYYSPDLKAGANLDLSLNLLAVDAETYGRTIYWPQDNSTATVGDLTRQLSVRREAAIKNNLVPAIVDSTLWDTLELTPGKEFVLSDSNSLGTKLSFVALAKVQHIPSLPLPGAMIVDATTYMTVYGQNVANSAPLHFNRVWLQARDGNSRTQIRITTALQNGSTAVDGLQDRLALIDTLHHAPLYLDLIGILALGPMTVLLLALVGNLLASWLNAHDRLSSFALLRALGAAPRQIASTLTWEQSIIYTTGMVLGVLFGAFVSTMIVPALLFTSSTGANTSSEELYLAQNIPPIQIIVPTLVGLAVAVLLGVCILALGMMIRIVSRPGIAQTLRLNED
ncbi:ABC transporter permease [Tengunoibacter tsumagoiensis]|uniref:ABC3 transporter permease C-terminal domain-containing protein n=1 Tax=Tengunoibacter tsumagoiensis TaxID=2014871 RepID=A0A401ZU92_9CHLR|nr:ABC transporter permease [Tengunoibacter tsumagoiensis]GCE10431.1 hypothetical protein KTT_02900 [Tengunoibacter tsumagoiensis]